MIRWGRIVGDRSCRYMYVRCTAGWVEAETHYSTYGTGDRQPTKLPCRWLTTTLGLHHIIYSTASPCNLVADASNTGLGISTFMHITYIRAHGSGSRQARLICTWSWRSLTSTFQDFVTDGICLKGCFVILLYLCVSASRSPTDTVAKSYNSRRHRV